MDLSYIYIIHTCMHTYIYSSFRFLLSFFYHFVSSIKYIVRNPAFWLQRIFNKAIYLESSHLKAQGLPSVVSPLSHTVLLHRYTRTLVQQQIAQLFHHTVDQLLALPLQTIQPFSLYLRFLFRSYHGNLGTHFVKLFNFIPISDPYCLLFQHFFN